MGKLGGSAQVEIDGQITVGWARSPVPPLFWRCWVGRVFVDIATMEVRKESPVGNHPSPWSLS